ncbi:hypothetical protein POVWA2_002500 [Plasmodium ovale wallikeri]|uniref:Uncharacterized protein n=1 Tax=Plasmodium ovale wallikeri TaxID=864142 RepID=A0A1A8YGB7_PLAOA|nr:hypothetical protein POVWA1_002560 [Plasmodium ovale wallikeri]SBT31136.1 hypothetical protein POVWA2_002500 [Plasmodium ovale wallikeri]
MCTNSPAYADLGDSSNKIENDLNIYTYIYIPFSRMYDLNFDYIYNHDNIMWLIEYGALSVYKLRGTGYKWQVK